MRVAYLVGISVKISWLACIVFKTKALRQYYTVTVAVQYIYCVDYSTMMAIGDILHTVVYTVVAGRVQHVLQGTDARHQLSVDPKLETRRWKYS